MSVLVHNLNRARSLEICLASIAAQTHRPLELVLLDAGSEDDSHSVISRARATMEGVGIRTRLIRCEKLGVGASRNLAARHARGDLLCFLDNDALFQSSGGVALAASEFARNRRLAALGFRVLHRDSQNVDPRSWIYRRSADPWASRSFETFIFTGGACCVRAAAFRGVEGYWEELPYAREEEEIGFALLERGWAIAYCPAVTVRHFPEPHGRLRPLERRRVELRNGALVLWRRLPLILAIPAIAGRVLTMSLRLVRHEGGGVAELWRALPEARRLWRERRLRRVPISFAGAWRYVRLHWPRAVDAT